MFFPTLLQYLTYSQAHSELWDDAGPVRADSFLEVAAAGGWTARSGDCGEEDRGGGRKGRARKEKGDKAAFLRMRCSARWQIWHLYCTLGFSVRGL